MKKRVITVSREFGSGGRDVGKQVADRLGIALYDRKLISKIAESSGLDPAYIMEFGEYATSTSSFLYNLDMYSGMPTGSIPVPDQLYILQYNVITELAEKEACVIIGRCSDYILRERNDCLHVFLHANEAFRTDRVVRHYGETADAPAKRLKETDDKRKVYYQYYTNRSWGMAKNYHLSLETSAIGIDKCADIIVDLVKSS